jgi:hypothetical protein
LKQKIEIKLDLEEKKLYWQNKVKKMKEEIKRQVD